MAGKLPNGAYANMLKLLMAGPITPTELSIKASVSIETAYGWIGLLQKEKLVYRCGFGLGFKGARKPGLYVFGKGTDVPYENPIYAKAEKDKRSSEAARPWLKRRVRMLRILIDHGPITLAELARRAGAATVGCATEWVRSLRKEKLVYRAGVIKGLSNKRGPGTYAFGNEPDAPYPKYTRAELMRRHRQKHQRLETLWPVKPEIRT